MHGRCHRAWPAAILPARITMSRNRSRGSAKVTHMQTILRTAVTHPSAWRGSDLKKERSWSLRLTGAQAADLERVAARVLAAGKPPVKYSRADFAFDECE